MIDIASTGLMYKYKTVETHERETERREILFMELCRTKKLPLPYRREKIIIRDYEIERKGQEEKKKIVYRYIYI